VENIEISCPCRESNHIIIGRTSRFEPQPSLNDSARFVHSLFTEQGCLSVSRLTPTQRTWSLYLCPPVREWPRYTPRHRVSFSSPLTTRRAAVEVFEPASTRGLLYSYIAMPPVASDSNDVLQRIWREEVVACLELMGEPATSIFRLEVS
jgi:hypothetical protein